MESQLSLLHLQLEEQQHHKQEVCIELMPCRPMYLCWNGIGGR